MCSDLRYQLRCHNLAIDFDRDNRFIYFVASTFIPGYITYTCTLPRFNVCHSVSSCPVETSGGIGQSNIASACSLRTRARNFRTCTPRCLTIQILLTPTTTIHCRNRYRILSSEGAKMSYDSNRERDIRPYHSGHCGIG